MSIPENDNQLWKGFNGHGLYAKRTERDRDGVIIDEAYARKSEIHQLENAVTESTDTELTPNAAKTAIDGILKAPTPGNEGTMLSYGISQNAMAWDAWESEMMDVPVNLLFLTYFNNFNNTTKIDTPLVGEAYSMSGGQSYTPSTLTINGLTYPAIYDVYGTSAGGPACVNKPVPEGIDFISSELWVYATGYRSDFSSGITLGCGPQIVIDPMFTYYEFPISGPYVGSCDTYTLYNGSGIDTSYPPGYFRMGTNIRHRIAHIAVVDDLVKKDSYYYTDGTLMYVLHGSRQSANYRYGLSQANTEKNFTVTGVAMFAGDRRINNGMNYPVPDKPYMQWPTT